MRKIISDLWKGQLYNAAHIPAGQPTGKKASYIYIVVEDIQHLDLFKGGPEPLENEINNILCSKREDRFSDHFSDLVQKICSVRFSYLLRLSIF